MKRLMILIMCMAFVFGTTQAKAFDMEIKGNCTIHEADVQEVFDAIEASAEQGIYLVIKSITGNGAIALANLPDGRADAETHGKYVLQMILTKAVGGDWLLTIEGNKMKGTQKDPAFISEAIPLTLELEDGGVAFVTAPDYIAPNITWFSWTPTNLQLGNLPMSSVFNWFDIPEEEKEAWIALFDLFGISEYSGVPA